MTDVAHAIGLVRKALREDPDYRFAWQANIAMFIWDELQRSGFEDADRKMHAACNRGAEQFLAVLDKETSRD